MRCGLHIKCSRAAGTSGQLHLLWLEVQEISSHGHLAYLTFTPKCKSVDWARKGLPLLTSSTEACASSSSHFQGVWRDSGVMEEACPSPSENLCVLTWSHLSVMILTGSPHLSLQFLHFVTYLFLSLVRFINLKVGWLFLSKLYLIINYFNYY